MDWIEVSGAENRPRPENFVEVKGLNVVEGLSIFYSSFEIYFLSIPYLMLVIFSLNMLEVCSIKSLLFCKEKVLNALVTSLFIESFESSFGFFDTASLA